MISAPAVQPSLELGWASEVGLRGLAWQVQGQLAQAGCCPEASSAGLLSPGPGKAWAAARRQVLGVAGVFGAAEGRLLAQLYLEDMPGLRVHLKGVQLQWEHGVQPGKTCAEHALISQPAKLSLYRSLKLDKRVVVWSDTRIKFSCLATWVTAQCCVALKFPRTCWSLL